jgi:HK97 family phage portal protein
MSLLAPLFQRNLYGNVSLVSGHYDNGGTLTQPASWFTTLMGGGVTQAGAQIDERTAEGLPAIYACVHVISETVGQLPLKLYRKTGKGKEPDPDHPLYVVLHDLMNPELTAMQGREMMTRHLALWGRSYAFIQRDRRGDIVALWPLHPARMFTERTALGVKLFRYWMGNGDYREWEHNPARPDILHLHINSEDGLDGRSPIRINRESLGLTQAAEQYAGSYFANSAVPAMILHSPKALTQKAKDNIRRSWLDRFMGAKNANKVAILDEGITMEVVGVEPDKSQLATLRAAQIEAAARIYRIPLFMIQSQTKDTSWGSGIEQQMLGFINLTMMPWFQQWQQVIARDLLTRQSFNTHEAIFIVNALVRGDMKTRFEAYASATRWMSTNLVRELEDLNPIEGPAGDVLWSPSGSLPMLPGAPIALEPETKPEPVAPEPDMPKRVM